MAGAAVFALLCGAAFAAGPRQPVWVVLVDRSLDSPVLTRTDAIRAVLLSGRAAVKSKGRVAAAGFTSDALSRMTFPVSGDFSKPPPGVVGDNPAVVKLARDAQVAALAADALQVLFPNLRVRGSDVIGALLATAKGPLRVRHGPALVVLASNMLDWSIEDRLFLTNGAPATAADRKLVLDRLANEGRIPNLHGACVLVIGAGRLANGTIGTTRYQQVEKFWRAYFTRAHARLAGWQPRVPNRLPAPCRA